MVDVFKLELEENIREHEKDAWQDLYAAYQNDTIIRGDIFGIEEHNIDGKKLYTLVVNFDGGIKGIIPQNEAGVPDYPVDEEGNKKTEFTKPEQSLIKKRLMQLVGQSEPIMVTEIVREENKVVLSREKALERLAEITWDRLTEGKVVSGKVRKTTRYRAVVEVGGINVSIPSKELSWGYANDPRGLFSVNEKIPVKITEIDRENKEIKASHRECIENPWPECAKRYSQGNLYMGRVTGVIEQAVFVNLEPGVDVYCKHMKFERVEPGEKVVVRIQGIDASECRTWGKIVKKAEAPGTDERNIWSI